ncbi:PHD and RING finger domain-containing protein 1 [Dinochytrium kinnereticum]|nr:PHD and RING finger domain-containing protein 1 [Dinochytrium kinnereticum]
MELESLELDDCAICLMKIEPFSVGEEELGVLKCDNVPHTFHLQCLLKWKEVETSCPKDRIEFSYIDVVQDIGAVPIRRIQVDQKTAADEDVTEVEEETICIICSSSGQEEAMLLCDACDQGYHLFCVGLDAIPIGDWFCFMCADHVSGHSSQVPAVVSTQARTLGSVRATRANPSAGSGGQSAAPPRRRRRTNRSSIMMAIRHEMAATRRQRNMEMRLYQRSGSSKRYLSPNRASELVASPAIQTTYAVAPARNSEIPARVKKRTIDEVEKSEEDPFRDIWRQFDSCRRTVSQLKVDSAPHAIHVQSGPSSNVYISSTQNHRLTSAAKSEIEATVKTNLTVPSHITNYEIQSGGKGKERLQQDSTEQRKIDISTPSDKGNIRLNIDRKNERSPAHFSKSEVFPFVKGQLDLFWKSERNVYIKDAVAYKAMAKAVTDAVFSKIKEARLKKEDVAAINALVNQEIQLNLAEKP